MSAFANSRRAVRRRAQLAHEGRRPVASSCRRARRGRRLELYRSKKSHAPFGDHPAGTSVALRPRGSVRRTFVAGEIVIRDRPLIDLRLKAIREPSGESAGQENTEAEPWTNVLGVSNAID